jgi:hypothetical protein
MLEGLPSLCADGREIYALAAARAGSIHASVQPLLLSSPVPQRQQLPAQPAGSSCIASASTAAGPGLGVAPAAADAGPQLPSLTITGLQRQGSGLSITTTSTATTWSRPAQTYSYPHNSRPLGLPQSSAAGGYSQQVQPQQQQEPWYADLKPDTGADGFDEDDDIMDSLSSVLSNRHYTPRLSLSYESRKAAAAAAASRQAAALSRAQTTGAVRTVPSGSAAAAGAAALTLAGIVSSGSWCQWPPTDADAGGVNSSQHTGVWDMISVHSPRSGSNALLNSMRQPLSPSSAASSRRGGASKAGCGLGPPGLLHSQGLSTWPESPKVVAVSPAAGQNPLASAQDSASSKPKLLANTHEVVSQYLQMVRNCEGAAATGTGQLALAPQNPTQQQQQLAQAAAAAPAGAAAGVCSEQTPTTTEAAHNRSNDTYSSSSSRASSFDSCITARSRFSLDIAGRPLAAASAQAHNRPCMGPAQRQPQPQQPTIHRALQPPSPSEGLTAVPLSGPQAATAGGVIQPRAVLQGVPNCAPQGVPQGKMHPVTPAAVHVAPQGIPQGASDLHAIPQIGRTAAAAAPARPVEALGSVAGLLSGAMPAGLAINSMTVGELLAVLSAAATQQQQQPAPSQHSPLGT